MQNETWVDSQIPWFRFKELAIRQDTLYLSAAQTESSGCVSPQPEYCDFSDWNFWQDEQASLTI